MDELLRALSARTVEGRGNVVSIEGLALSVESFDLHQIEVTKSYLQEMRNMFIRNNQIKNKHIVKRWKRIKQP